MDLEDAGLFRSGAKIAIFTAHPDDTEFYLGGLLLRLAETGSAPHLIVATDGDKGYYPFARPERLRRIRRQEQREAGAAWQAEEVVFLGHRDGRLRETPELRQRIGEELRRIQPEYVFLFEYRYPPNLTHQDHLCAGRVAFQVMQETGIGRWALHFATRAPNYVADVTEEWERRRQLLRYHASQWKAGRLRTVETLVMRDAEMDGRRIGVRYGEGLRCVRSGI